MKTLQPLNQEDYNIKIVKDLGMRGTTPSRVRWAEFECPACKNTAEKAVNQVKVGTKRGLSNKCKACANREKATTHGCTGTDLHNRWLKNESEVQ